MMTELSKPGQRLSGPLYLLIAETPESESCSLRLLNGGVGVPEGYM